MKILRKIIRRLEANRERKNSFNAIRRLGGVIWGNTKFVNQGTFHVGRNVTIAGEGIDNVMRSQIVILKDAVLEIGDNTGMSQVSITCKQKIHIGSNVKIGAGTLIFDTNFHSIDWKIRADHDKDLSSAQNAPIHIGDHVFIGTRSIICKGVTIGDRSIIAAGSIVVKDIPADCIAGGNPCRVIKYINENSSN